VTYAHISKKYDYSIIFNESESENSYSTLVTFNNEKEMKKEYERIKNLIFERQERFEAMPSELEQLRQMIYFAPGGAAFQKAESSFNVHKSDQLNIKEN
tara:strand:- start:12162 stop:12458 length:297 start_codon:yes stop_codon:yes gene_type:complete